MKLTKLHILLLILSLFSVSCGTVNREITTNEFRALSETDYFDTALDKDTQIKIAKQIVTNASVFKQQGKYAEAIIEYQEALRFDTSAAIYFSLAESYWYLGKRISSIENCRNAIKLDSIFVPAYELLYSIYSNDNRYSEAFVIAEQILAIEPNRTNRLRYAALKGIEDPEESAKLLETMLTDSTDTEMMLFLSTAYLQSEQHDKMQIILERLHKDQPSNFEVSNTLFDLYSKKSDFANLFRILESSEKYFDAAQTIEVYNNIGINLLSADFKKDSTFIRSFISRFDERLYFDWISQSIAGKLSSNILDNEATIIFFERALFLNDTNSFIYLDAAISYYTLKLYQKSIELLKVGQAKFPDDSRFDYYLCNAYMLTKDYVTAESYGEKLFQSDSSNILFINLYASILQELEKYEKSDSLYELSLSIDPDDANTNNNYAYSLSIRSKELSKAQMLSHSSLQSEPDNSAFLDTFGWIQFKKGNLESALEYVQKAIDVGEFSSEVFEHLGDIYIGLDNKPAALEAYLKSLELADVKKSEVVDKINLLKD